MSARGDDFFVAFERAPAALDAALAIQRAMDAAARICFAGHGGQIVLSSAVGAAVIESLADGISLRSLGARRFQGLPEPVDLFQVEAADLLSDAPRLDRPPPPGKGPDHREGKT